ncbi:MAG: BON domain-containing protein [Chloroflexi bacterium]|nr:BON domain-containing protein [Chloroflexota bacterium]
MAAQIARELDEKLDLNVLVQEADGLVTLHGCVDSVEARKAAEQIAASIAPEGRIESYLAIGTEAGV